MSIQTELTRITNAKAAIKTAIEGKGVTVPEATLLDGMAALIESIETDGGGVSFETGTVTFVENTIPYTFVEKEPDLFICYIEQPLKDNQTNQAPDALKATSTSTFPYLWSFVQYKKDWHYYFKQSKIMRSIGYNDGKNALYAAHTCGLQKIGTIASSDLNTTLGAQTYRWFALYGVTIQ